MTLQALKTRVESLIRQAEIGPALSLIELYANQPDVQGSAFRDNALLLSARYASLKDQQIKGTLKPDEYSKELARLAESILSLLNVPSTTHSSIPWSKMALLSLLVILTALGIWWAVFRGPSPTLSDPSIHQQAAPDSTSATTIERDTVHESVIGGMNTQPPVTVSPGKKKTIDSPSNPQKPKDRSTAEIPKPTPVKIKVFLKADSCWRDASIEVNDKTIGTMAGIIGSFTLTLNEEVTKVRLVKGERVSTPITRVLEDEDTLLFKCN